MLKFQDLFLTSEVFTDSINEVIKTGDVTDFESLKELRDYVITPSILKTFNQFFSNYYDKATGDNIGVWISGAFGSGKSHFLHILSYLSENKTINYNGQVYQTADIFLQKLSENLQEIEADLKEKENDKNLIELQKDNLTLREYIQKLKNAKTHSILFNIQSQSETIEEKSILKPLLSMFNNFLGYYRDSIYLANFERSLDGNGLFDEFKKIYEIQNNKTWEVDRGSYLSVYSNIINAYSYVSNISEEEAKTNFDNLIKRDYFSLKSINFAELIKEYTDKTGYKLCFFIDEISQFIGSNEKLLLELQTIVEDLGSICKGNAWLVVSAQAELGELVNAKDGFSKILGRFRTQLSLTSSNMPIIIRKRILEKTPEAKMQLQTFYRNYESAIRSSTSIELKNSSSKLEPNKNKEEFAGNFPFLQMHYELLETFLTNLKLTGSALGKYISNGERSLLRSFQYVIKGFNQKFPEFDERSPIDINNEYANNISQGIKTKPYNQSYLVPFYEFYDSIEKDLDFDIRKVFQDASNKGRLNNFDINILKTTFLIRYLDNILTRNLDTVVSLSINKVEMDSDFKDKVQESLERLENNFLITRQGEEYIFLTSRESEIENEIRNFTIPNIDKQINSIARDIIFDKTLTKKVSHTYHNVTFDIKRYFNSELTKNTSDGEINLYIDSNANDKEWMSQQVSITGSYKSFEKSKEHNGCIVIELNEHKTFYDNIEYFLKTKEYIAKMDGNTNLTD
ncbi:MAG: BREX system P-loop protein BrxC, partial [Psittacicella sp.]